MVNDLPDIQGTKPKIKIPLRRVGVEDVMVPFLLESKGGVLGFHNLVANVTMLSNLESDIKGISMSRCIRTLKQYLGKPLKHKLIFEILKDLKNNLETQESYMKFEFAYPKMKQAPASMNSFPLYYKCFFHGQLQGSKFKFYQGVKVQYASYCPCSSELCNDLRSKESNGFPHAQRSFADVVVQTIEPNYVWLEDIIDDVENSIKTLPYPIIKREDEQRIAEIASQNPIFVEDAIRQISQTLGSNEKYFDWIVKCTHEESIHTSQAIAMNWKGVGGGFNGSYFL